MKFAVNSYRKVAFATITMLLVSAAFLVDFTTRAKANDQQTPVNSANTALMQGQSAVLETPAGKLCQAAIDAAMKGNFKTALEKIELATEANPKNSQIRTVKKLIAAYQKQARDINAKRLEDFNYEKQRIESAQIAQNYEAQLAKSKWGKQFRKNLSADMTKAFNNIGTAFNFNDCDKALGEKMKKSSLAAIDKMVALIDDSAKLTASLDNNYVRRFREEAKSAKAQLARVRKVWQKVDPSTEFTRWDGSIAILKTQHDLTNVIADLNVIVAKKPWKMVLIHTSNAKDIAPANIDVTSQPWFKSVITEAHKRGQVAIKRQNGLMR